MLDPDDSLTFSADGFSGIARVFPLPNVVMFPHVMQPLHIFEPRYRAMLEEAVADDRLIALGMLAPGWESHHEDRPPLMPTACLCRVATHKRTEGGTYNVLMLGVRRVRLTRSFRLSSRFESSTPTFSTMSSHRKGIPVRISCRSGC